MENKCELCESGYDFRMIQIKETLGKMSICLSSSMNQVNINQEDSFKYCPKCGKKLTEDNFR